MLFSGFPNEIYVDFAKDGPNNKTNYNETKLLFVTFCYVAFGLFRKCLRNFVPEKQYVRKLISELSG